MNNISVAANLNKLKSQVESCQDNLKLIDKNMEEIMDMLRKVVERIGE